MTTCQTCHHNEADECIRSAEPMCISCYNQSVRDAADARKAQLAAMPRCECCGKARGTVQVLGKVLMCGRCYKRLQTNAMRSTPANLRALSMFAPVAYSRDDLLQIARQSA